MRSTLLFRLGRSLASPSPRFGLTLGLFALFELALLPSCASPPAPTPTPVIAPRPAPPPPPPPPPVQQYEQKVIVIHQADLFGQFESKQGHAITIRALLMMTKTQPELGQKGVLYTIPAGAKNDSDWVPLGDVEIHRTLDPDGRLQVKIVDDEKKFVIPGGKRPTPLVKSTRVRLRWQW